MTTAAHVLTRPAPGSRIALALLAMIVISTSALLVLGGGAIGLAFLPLLAAVGAYVIWRLPLRVTALSLFGLALFLEVPNERPAAGAVRSPFYQVGAFVFDNLNNVTGIEALRFSGLDLLILLMLFLLVTRSWRERDYLKNIPAAGVLYLFLALEVAAVIGLELFGLARGGDFKQSLWQVRPILWLPVLAAIFAVSLRGPEDFRIVGKLVVVSAMLKTLHGLTVYFFFARPNGWDLPYMTTHSDSVHYVAAISVCFAWWTHRPTLRNLTLYGLASALIVAGIVVNNRRIAWVGLIAALWVMFAVLKHGRVKRAMATMLVVLSPFIAAYVAIGSKSQSSIFAPAASIVSVFTQTDASSGTRDIENYNLIQTLKTNPLVGTGLGHEYLEISKAYDITGAFSQYRFIGHNSVLWLWSVAGIAGFTVVWLTLVVTAFLARRAYALATRMGHQVAASWVLAVLAAYLVQAWGDMGMHGWVIVLLLSMAIALSGKLAFATGAWPHSTTLSRKKRKPPEVHAAPAPFAPEVVS